MLTVFVILVAAALVSAARADTAALHPLSEILVSGPDFSDVGTNSITVKVETSIPVVCAAVYGTTTAYGSLATDMDMAAGGHRVHHPTLRGLAPDTAYQIRMQGVGPDGTLYVSDNFTIRTLAPGFPDEAKPAGTNVALISAGARVAGVSSNYGGGSIDSSYGANNAFDGDPGSEWSSNGDGDKAWIAVDLGKSYAITGIGFLTRTMGTSAQIESFQVVTEHGDKFGPFALPDARSPHYFPLETSARQLRFEVLKSSGGNTGAGQIEVYAR